MANKSMIRKALKAERDGQSSLDFTDPAKAYRQYCDYVLSGDDFFMKARILDAMKTSREYEAQGFKTFGDWVNSPHCPVNQRTVYSLLKVFKAWTLLVSAEIDTASCRKIVKAGYKKFLKFLPFLETSRDPIKIRKIRTLVDRYVSGELDHRLDAVCAQTGHIDGTAIFRYLMRRTIKLTDVDFTEVGHDTVWTVMGGQKIKFRLFIPRAKTKKKTKNKK